MSSVSATGSSRPHLQSGGVLPSLVGSEWWQRRAQGGGSWEMQGVAEISQKFLQALREECHHLHSRVPCSHATEAERPDTCPSSYSFHSSCRLHGSLLPLNSLTQGLNHHNLNAQARHSREINRVVRGTVLGGCMNRCCLLFSFKIHHSSSLGKVSS